MPARNSQRDTAKAEYIKRRRAGEKINLKEFADRVGVPYGTVRNWKRIDQWDESLERKRGGQPGNRNSKGKKNAKGNHGGAPRENKNAEKDGAYSAVFFDKLSDEEKKWLDNLPTGAKENTLLELRVLRYRQKKILAALEKYSECADDDLYIATLTDIGQKAVGLGKGAVGGVKNFAGNTLYGAKTLAGNIASSKVGQTAVKIGGGAVQGVKDVTQFLGAGLNVGQTVLGPVAGKLGGAFMGLLGTFGPVIAGIGSIIAVVSLLGDHFADIQQIVLKVFGPTGLTIFNTFFADVKKIGDGIKNAFSMDNLLNIQEKLSGKSMFGVDLGQAFGAAIPIIQSVTGLVSQIVDLGVNHIKPLLADVMSFVVNELFPAVVPLIGTIIDLVGTTLVNAIKVIVDVIHNLLPVIEPVIQGIVGLIKGIASIGVSVVNTIIRALNKIHIKMPTKILGISLPEGIAGKEWGFSLAEVPAPAFANGGFTHGVSIAGEAGTEAVISFKRSVHDENVNHWVRAGRMLGVTGEDATRAIGTQNVSYFANGGFTDGSREKLDNLIDFGKAYGEYALRSNGIRTAGDAASLLWSVANNSMAGDGSLALAATSIAADVAPIVLKKYLGDNEATSLLTEAAKTYNGGTVLSSWENGVLTDTGVPLYILPPRDAGTTELSEIPQAAYRSSRTSGGGDGDGMQFVFSPQITAYGKADRAEIEQIMREQFEKFKAEIKQEIKEEQRREQRTKYA